MGKPETNASQIGDSVFLEKVSGTPGYPEADGSKLLNLPQSGGAEAPGTVSFGSILFYPSQGGGLSNEIQYVRVKLAVGKTYDRGLTFIDSGGTAGRTIRIGVYDQVDPLNATQDPNNKIAETDAVTLAAANGTYISPEFTDGLGGSAESFIVPISGFYWIALIQSSNAIKFAVTAQTYRANLSPRREEAGTGGLLPAAVGDLSNPASAAIFVGIVEQGITI